MSTQTTKRPPSPRSSKRTQRASRLAARQRSRQVMASAEDPLVAARLAGLTYVNDSRPGIRRKRAGKGFTYIGLDGQAIREQAELARIKKLGIPPAWTDVWICPSPRGHIQATGRDAKGRKQYRYHDLWRCIRDETKFSRMIAFGRALPRIRARVSADLAQPGLTRERVLATAVRLLDETLIRVGNEEYTQQNESYGLTTLHSHHVEVDGPRLRFQFRGKGGKERDVEVTDRRAARIISRLQELPGEELFQYRDADGEVRTIGSGDVNAYLREIGGEEFTAKDFRTWGGTVTAAEALKQLGDFETQTQAKHNLAQAIKAAAAHLGNTPAICKKSYVHPGVLDAYLNHLLSIPTAAQRPPAPEIEGLRPEEAELLALLEELAAQTTAPAKAG